MKYDRVRFPNPLLHDYVWDYCCGFLFRRENFSRLRRDHPINTPTTPTTPLTSPTTPTSQVPQEPQQEEVRIPEEEGEQRSREDMPSYKEYELMARMYEEGGWLEEVEDKEREEQEQLRLQLGSRGEEMTQEQVERELDEEDELRRVEKEEEEDFVEEEEVRERISEVLETRDEEGNMLLGDLPQVVGDTLAWPLNPTQEQLDTPIGPDLERYVKGRGEDFERAVRMEAGGDVITQGTLIEVTRAWEQEEALATDEVVGEVENMTSMSSLLEEVKEEEEEVEGRDLFMGALELCLAMLVANRVREDEMDAMEEIKEMEME